MMNPFQIIQMMKGGNPQKMIQQLMGNNEAMKNPMFKNAMTMYQNNDTKGLKNMAENLCKSRGTTVEELRKQLGI